MQVSPIEKEAIKAAIEEVRQNCERVYGQQPVGDWRSRLVLQIYQRNMREMAERN